MKELNPIINIDGTEFVQIFKLSNLDPSAKKNAIENYRNIFTEDGFEIRDSLRYYFSEMLKQHGLPDEDIRWSLSYSQGDGVAFYGNIDIGVFFNANPKLKAFVPQCMKLLEIYNELRLTGGKNASIRTLGDLFSLSIFKSNSFYDHERSMGISIDVYLPDIESYLDELSEQIRGSFMPDDEVDLSDWQFNHVEGSKWTIEDTTRIWEVTIDENGMALYEYDGANIPDIVKKTFNEKTNTQSYHRFYPGVYISESMIEKEMMELETALLGMFADISKDLKSDGYKIYEGITNDESIAERIDDLDIRFDIAGDIIHTKS